MPLDIVGRERHVRNKSARRRLCKRKLCAEIEEQAGKARLTIITCLLQTLSSQLTN
jgi:hypothetical protein